jgi:hypothetical protein
MSRSIINASATTRRRPSRCVIALAMLSMVATACAGTEPSVDESTGPSTPATTTVAPPTQPPATTESTVVETAATSTIEPTVPTTRAPATRVTLPIPLGDDDRVFVANTDALVVASAPPPWEPFSRNKGLGMRREFDTGEWVGISFWDAFEVATDSCQWRGSFENPGESVTELADALVAVPGRQATAPVPVTVGGYDGIYLEWSLSADLDPATCDEGKTVAWTAKIGRTRAHDPGEIDRIWILEVEGERILIDVLSLPGWQGVTGEPVDEVIESLRFVVDS